MIVSEEIYQAMKAIVMNAISTNTRIQPKDAIEIGVEYDALMSLYGQMFVRNLKKEIRSISENIMQEIVKRSQQGESLVTMSNEFHIGSFKFAKLYLEAVGERNIQISSLLVEPTQIKDERIRNEILQLISLDPVCSHELEQLKECLGREYEELLINLLNEKKMCFETEAELRSKGKPKTPDILFSIPMATTCTYRDLLYNCNDTSKQHLHTPSRIIDKSNKNIYSLDDYNENNKVVINWIDSKAMFADIATFNENLEQFHAYNNRYGRGMVIYWHGFSEDISSKLLIDDMIIIRDSLPDEWIFPTGEKADGRIPAFDLL